MSNSYISKLLLLAVMLLSFNTSFAQNLATWTFENLPNVTTKDLNVNASNVTLGAGVNPASTAYPTGVTGQAIAATAFNVITTIKTDEYFEFTITPTTNFSQTLSSITFASFRTSTGPSTWELRSSLDSYNSTLAMGANPTSFATQTANLSIIANILMGVTFRLYGYGATNTTGNWRIDDLKINGTVSTALPNISVSKTNMSFGSLGQGSPSTPLSYTVIGSNLIDNIAINASSGYTISETPNGVYTSTLSLIPVSGSINVPIYVKQNNDNLGAINGTITHTSTSVTTQTVTTSGFINATLTSFSPIFTARAAANGTAVTVQGYVTVSSQFGGNQIFIQDGTGGISVFNGSENFVDVYGLQIGDFVQIAGTRGSFNGLTQIGTPMTIQKNTTPPSVQTPITIPSSQMSAYEGQLVRITDLPNPPGTTTFAANTNYVFNTTQVRISGTVNAPFSNNLVGSTINTGTSNITGIVGLFNSTSQLLPRFVSDIENVNALPFYGNDLSFGTSATLDIGCWNIEWLGHPTQGPSNNTLQKDYAGSVLNTLKLDVINVNEVSDEALLGQVAAAAGSNYTHTCSQEISNTTLALDPLSQRVCFIYNTDVLSNVTTTALLLDVKANPASFFPNATLGYPAYPQNDPSNFFASGRLPYAMTADVTLNGITKRMMFVGLHAKANTAPTDISYYRRQLDMQVLKDRMDQLYPNLPFVVLGDFNDDIDVSIYNAAFESTYKNFVDDVTDYRFLTGQASLTDRKKSTVSFNEMIDHLMISNEMFNAYESSSARVGTPDLYIPNYGNSTSDHYPVMARFNIANIILPVTLLDFKASLAQNKTVTLNWQVADEKNFKHYIVEKSTDGRTFFAIKQVKAEGISTYKTIDEQPFNRTTYYRLRMVDSDDSYDYSKVISVEKKALDKTFKIYPNPTSNVFFVENTEGASLDITIYNVNGQVVKKGIKTNRIDVSDLSNGMYIIEGKLDNSVVLREKLFKN